MMLFSWLNMIEPFIIPTSFMARLDRCWLKIPISLSERLFLGDRINNSQYLHTLFNQRLILSPLRGKLAEDILRIACNLINTK